ncbi:helix-turn-helix domain-containing protein [Streptomyces cavernicola]|uniref:Helix-turn-helix transcriptional regulator n=1 Tax=Streptomyces cavernicola TaxID=3043613 RepID=A0ABT6SL54_9ACTN|nr:helix-turn-helix transcriptional regulator [Streptomyces sp. B-S-A6]MDI3408397.1 helix-turn-helix transcriptional regulator [Streptomyces sp. B-S-A6]
MTSTYGEWLRSRREALGMTQEQLAREAHMTRSHIAHIEAGRRIPSAEDARRLDKALGTGDVLSSFRPSGEGAVADYFESARELERQAVMLREFAPVYVPGILQTRRYATAVIGASFPPLAPEECDRLVVTRLQRSEILQDPVTPVVWALLDEGVLHRPVGGPDVMAEQIEHLAGLVESQRIRVHVMPTAKGAYHVLQGMVTLMWFDDQPPAAYTEGLSVGTVHESPAGVERLRSAYDLALSDALPLDESLDFMRARAKEYRRHD